MQKDENNRYQFTAKSIFVWTRKGSDYYNQTYRDILVYTGAIGWGIVVGVLLGKAIGFAKLPILLIVFSLLIVFGIHCLANYRINYLKKDVCVTLRNMIFVFDQTKNQILVLLNENDGVGMPVFERNGFYCARRRENAIYLIGRPNAELLSFLERNVTKYKTPPMEYHESLIKLISDDSNFADEIEALLVKPVTESFLL
jgi:hypothetical protein